MMSMHNSTHSSQMKTVGPAISLRTSCWLLPQKEQYKVFLLSLPLALLIPTPCTQRVRFTEAPLSAGTAPLYGCQQVASLAFDATQFEHAPGWLIKN